MSDQSLTLFWFGFEFDTFVCEMLVVNLRSDLDFFFSQIKSGLHFCLDQKITFNTYVCELHVKLYVRSELDLIFVWKKMCLTLVSVRCIW